MTAEGSSPGGVAAPEAMVTGAVAVPVPSVTLTVIGGATVGIVAVPPVNVALGKPATFSVAVGVTSVAATVRLVPSKLAWLIVIPLGLVTVTWLVLIGLSPMFRTVIVSGTVFPVMSMRA